MSDTHTATVDAAAFYRAVANAALFAGTDDTLPSLCTVHLTAGEPGELIAEATNRYVVSRETVDLINPDPGPDMTDRATVIDHLHDTKGNGHGGDYAEDHQFVWSTGTHDIVAGHNAKHEHDAGHTHESRPVPVTDLDVLVQVKGLVKITKMLKQLEERFGTLPAPRIVIDYTDGERHAAFTLTGQASEPDQTLRAEVLDSEFPRISRFFTTHREPRKAEPGMAEVPAGDMPTEWTIAQPWLALLAKVDDGEAAKSRHVDVSAGLPQAPVMFTVGKHFRAMVVPIRKAA